jgi:hypothetical protein
MHRALLYDYMTIGGLLISKANSVREVRAREACEEQASRRLKHLHTARVLRLGNWTRSLYGDDPRIRLVIIRRRK